jgi:hypothetical protein
LKIDRGGSGLDDNKKSSNHQLRRRSNQNNLYDTTDDWDDCFLDDDDFDSNNKHQQWCFGSGREFSVFRSSPPPLSSRGGDSPTSDGEGVSENMLDDNDDDDDDDIMMRMERYRRDRNRQGTPFTAPNKNDNGDGTPSFFTPSASYQNGPFPRTSWRREQQHQKNVLPIAFQKVQDWWKANVGPNIQSLPKMVCRVEPTTTLKLRKTFRPLKTIIRFAAEFNTQLGVWQFKSSWEDAIIGGKLTLAGRELQLTKSWQLSVGAVEDLVTRLRFRAAINLQTFQAYCRVGFRTERLTPINVVEGFTILKRIPLDGAGGNVKLEVKANIALPEPEIEYSTDAHRSLIGMGDVEISIEELNLLLDY